MDKQTIKCDTKNAKNDNQLTESSSCGRTKNSTRSFFKAGPFSITKKVMVRKYDL
jgi:hypothetical protein